MADAAGKPVLLFLVFLLRQSLDLDFGHAVPFDLCHFHVQPFVGRLIADGWDPTDIVKDQTADRFRLGILGKLDIQRLRHVIHQRACVCHHRISAGDRLDQFLLGVVFVLDIADDFLD